MMTASPELAAGEFASRQKPAKCTCSQDAIRMKTLTRHLSASLETALQYNQAVMESVSDGIVILDDKFKIRQANQSAEKMFEVEPGGLLGKNLWSFRVDQPEQNPEKYLEIVGETRGVDEPNQQLFASAAERLFYTEVSINPLVLGDVILQVIVLRNVDGFIQKVNALADHRRQIQELYACLLSAHEEERKRIFRELHDEVGQRITALRFGIHRMFDEIGRPSEDLAGALTYQIEEISRVVRSLSADLQPAVLQYAGLMDAFEDLANQFSVAAGLKVALNFEGLRREQRFDPELELAVYRIGQESLNNALKYAGVGEVGVLLAVRDPVLIVSVWDEGAGFDPGQISKKAGSTGILGMKERAALLGGNLRISSVPGEGTTVLAEIPIGGRLSELMQSREEQYRYDEDFDRR